MSLATATFYEAGSVTDHINVEISFQAIKLFSEGLYSSPNKAIEELVSNAFDADATCVHTVMSADRASAEASIAILDNGTGMDSDGLKVHWIVGESAKSRNRVTGKGRRTIGKFGIGKLAAYVLGDRLTHLTKSNGKYYSTSMDFTVIPPSGSPSGRATATSADPVSPVQLDLRELTEAQAHEAVRPWLTDANGRPGLQLFGSGAEDSWTIAIITDLKPMATDLSIGMLKWVLATAMPLRDDFALHLNGKPVDSSKAGAEKIGMYTIGNDIVKIPHPAPQELAVELNGDIDESDYHHWSLTDSLLGPVTGYLEVFQEPIDSGKSENIGRSNGFFVYVNGRLINEEDAGFGIDRNSLRHGTFSRFRVVINIDRLDGELRSSRETLRAGAPVDRAREILRGLFNLARVKLESFEAAQDLERRASQRFADSPASLAERPLLRMAVDSYTERYQPRHIVPIDKAAYPTEEALVEHIEERVKSGAGLIGEVVYEDVGTLVPMAVLDATSGKLSINLDHPFVAHFSDEFSDHKKNLPLELFAAAEVLLEAELNDANIGSSAVSVVLDQRDALLRHLARSSGARNSLTVAQALLNAVSSAKGLELALVDAFQQLGFEAVHKAKKGEADGLAEAHLSASETGRQRSYRVALEAKSKEKAGAKVKKSAVEVSTIVRHRDDLNCQYALVVGPDFETGPDNLGAVVQEIQTDLLAHPDKRITLMRVRDLARLVRLAPAKRLNLETLGDLFLTCQTPDEAAEWVDALEQSSPPPSPHPQIVEMVWELQQELKDHPVQYPALMTALRYKKNLTISEHDLKSECLALSRMAPNQFIALDDRVELNIKPETLLTTIHAYIDALPEPEEEQ